MFAEGDIFTYRKRFHEKITFSKIFQTCLPKRIIWFREIFISFYENRHYFCENMSVQSTNRHNFVLR